MTGLTLATVLHTAMMAIGADGETYAEAYQQAVASGAPMVVFVSTEWCAPCQQMKRNVLPEVRKLGVLDKVVFAMVDPDREDTLSRTLIGGGPIPQLLMYRSTPAGWMRRRLVGGQSVGAVEEFINQGLALDAAAKKAQTQQVNATKTAAR
jgi:thiol-disulfide isomerase/thioredoxin